MALDEVRTVHRVGLVEQGENLELAVNEQTFQRDIGARHKGLNQERVAWVTSGFVHDGTDPSHRFIDT